MRKPSFDPPEIMDKPRDQWETQIRDYELITPLYGGGVDPNEPDPITVVRATEIRGHLRFWWRATRGGQFDGDLRKMKQAEDELFGCAATEGKKSGHSQVQVEVFVQESDRGTVFSVKNYKGVQVPIGDLSSPFSYVAFPLREMKEKAKVLEGVRFQLRISFPLQHEGKNRNFKKEMEAALWAWETFGGMGARTRRGFGALHLLKVNDQPAYLPQVTALETYFQQKLAEHVVAGAWPADVPHLNRTVSASNKRFVKFTVANPNPIECWKGLFVKLKEFRQKRNPGEGKPGRSKWPEPDAIRSLTRFSAPKHSIPLSNVRKFPRAAFGLPIIFQFKDKSAGDPKDTSLQGQEHDRLGSPLILRPLKCADGKAVGLAVILDAPLEPPGGLKLQNAPGNPSVTRGLTPNEANTIVPISGETDVLQAFLKTI